MSPVQYTYAVAARFGKLLPEIKYSIVHDSIQVHITNKAEVIEQVVKALKQAEKEVLTDLLK